jgi:hypothetical protein
MPCQLSNHSDVDLSSLEPHVQGMYDFFDQKIGFKKPPTMHFDSDPSNQSNVLGKTAYYDPSSLEIHVFTDGRHPKDMLRSIAHELIHHQQNLEDRLDVGGYMGQGYYLQNEAMKELEQEAMLKGNDLMREYEDTTKSEEMNKMSLKEWKNNELNKLLLEKFGILKEEKTPKHDENPKLKGGQKGLPDSLQKGIIDSTNEEMNEDLDDDGGVDESTMTEGEEEELNEEAKETATDEMYRKALERGIEKGKKQAAERKKKEAEAEKAKKESPLQEALNKILKAKSITLKSSGKKIK